jgi:hypothetical protein
VHGEFGGADRGVIYEFAMDRFAIGQFGKTVEVNVTTAEAKRARLPPTRQLRMAL